jgi:hypothetical protein
MLRPADALRRKRAEVETRGRGQDGDDGDGRHGGRLGLHGVEMTGLDALLAAAVRGRHAHAATTALHLLAAGMFLRCHLGIGKSTRHRRRKQRQKQCQDNGPMTQAAHPFLA